MVDILNVSSYIILFGFLAFYFTFITTCIILAVFGVTFGVRTTYIKILRKVFEVLLNIYLFAWTGNCVFLKRVIVINQDINFKVFKKNYLISAINSKLIYTWFYNSCFFII